MADTPDPQELARRYLDLWQQHLTQAATDPDLAATTAKFWQTLQSGMATGIPGWPPVAVNTGAAHNSGPNDDAARSEFTSEHASGSAPDSASPDSGGGNLDELLDRMAALEKRLDSMEQKPRSSRKRAAKGPRKRKP
jgi:hypothetical protein